LFHDQCNRSLSGRSYFAICARGAGAYSKIPTAQIRLSKIGLSNEYINHGLSPTSKEVDRLTLKSVRRALPNATAAYSFGNNISKAWRLSMEQLLSSGFRPVLRPEAEMWLRLGFIINNSDGIIR
jgi:hypothetical protein